MYRLQAMGRMQLYRRRVWVGVMTIEKAREILGKEACQLNNDQVQAIIDCFEGIIEVGFEQFEKKLQEDFDNGRLSN